MAQWRIVVTLTAACVAALLLGPKMSDKPIKIALDRHWATLHPGLQHTRNGDLVLSNQFDALVGTNAMGAPVPLGAKSWDVSDDFRTYRFIIDTEKRFSDGTHLTAHDYKRSWEEALALSPKSANSSLADVATFIEGFEHFDERKELTGVKVINPETLEVTFKQPLRLALDFLSGNRFAAYKRGNGKDEYIGTGKYVIKKVNDDELILTPNPFSDTKPNNVSLVYVPTIQSREDLIDGSIDAIGYSAGDEILAGRSLSESVAPVIGQDAMHAVLALNGLKGRIFADPMLRKAMQWYVITRVLPNATDLIEAEKAGFFKADPQIFLPFQAGRLADDEAQKLVEQGKDAFAQLITHSKGRPIRVWVTDTTKWLLPALRSAGLTVSDDSGFVEPKDRIRGYYRTHEPDLLVVNVSVTNSDPDGSYHVLGQHGAISSPMVQRKRTMELMEAGRAITDLELVNSHYAQVSRAVLEEVPFIHLGFSKIVSLLRKDRVEIEKGVQLRNQGHLHIFKRK